MSEGSEEIGGVEQPFMIDGICAVGLRDMPAEDGEIIVRLADGRTATVPAESPLHAVTIAAGLPLDARPVPATITPLQARKAINQAGLRDSIEAHVGTLDQDARDAWQYATTIERDNGIIVSAAAALGMTEVQVDDLFRAGAML